MLATARNFSTPSAAEEDPAARLETGARARRRILIVDDDESVGSVVSYVANLEGYTVCLARNGHEALRKLAAGRYDLLVTDIYMPGHDGLELIRSVRAEKRDLKIIAMSGGGIYGFNPLKIAGLLGAAHVIEKPFEIDNLAALLRG